LSVILELFAVMESRQSRKRDFSLNDWDVLYEITARIQGLGEIIAVRISSILVELLCVLA
jgi:hypothetical protein